MVLNQNLDDSKEAGHFFVKTWENYSAQEDMDVHSARCDCNWKVVYSK